MCISSTERTSGFGSTESFNIFFITTGQVNQYGNNRRTSTKPAVKSNRPNTPNRERSDPSCVRLHSASPFSHHLSGVQYDSGHCKTNEAAYCVKAGLSRTVTFADGNSAFERMLFVDYPNYFSCKLENFTDKGLSSLVERVDGAWVFIALEEKKVMIDWKYVITPKTDEAKKIIQEHLLPDFQGMLDQAINISKENLESGRI